MLLAVLLLASAPAGAGGLDGVRLHRAEQLISIFENATPVIQYGYAEDIGDGRGITAGRAGFTTATGDAVLVVRRYATLRPDAPILAWLPELERLAAAADDDTGGLQGFAAAWAAAAEDPGFRQAQDEINAELYFDPVNGYADELGLQTALARAALYDAIIQHGDGDDPDSLWSMIDATEAAVGGWPSNGVDEVAWLRAFLAVRRGVLAHATDPATREGWAESVGRVDVWSALLDDGNLDLDGPIRLTLGYYEIDIE
ncbi:MAG: chitosanase [Alphaproteobacteria bacterium]